ncbi:MAG: acyltransferase [Candidatus Dormibacteraeota bacterium]|nr:acyltransferase [Candidatus Dormibacteraeota bacterium]
MGLDLVRVLALLAVIAIHCDHWPYQSSGLDRRVWTTLDLLLRVSVPLFMVLSGFLLTYGEQHALPVSQFLRRRLGRSLIPWIVWVPAYTLIGVFLTKEVQPSWAGVATWWALGGGHLWYLLLIPQLYLLFQIWPSSNRGLLLAALASLAIQVALSTYRLLAPADTALNSFLLAYGYQVAPLWLGYFGIGLLAGRWRAQHLETWHSWGLTGVFAVAMVGGAVLLVLADGSGTPNAQFVQGTGAFLLPSLIPLTIASFVTWGLAGERLLAARPAVTQAVQEVSRYSLGIYIVHEALTYLTGPLQYAGIARASLAVSLVIFLFQVLVTFVLAYVVTRVLAATPLAITVGLPPRPPRWSAWRRPFAI